MRITNAASEWVFPAQTRSTLRHTCLTRWAPHMDPWTLAYLAGHRDMSITKRYIHPQEQSTRAAIERLLRNVDRRSAISYKRFRRNTMKNLALRVLLTAALLIPVAVYAQPRAGNP